MDLVTTLNRDSFSIEEVRIDPYVAYWYAALQEWLVMQKVLAMFADRYPPSVLFRILFMILSVDDDNATKVFSWLFSFTDLSPIITPSIWRHAAWHPHYLQIMLEASRKRYTLLDNLPGDIITFCQQQNSLGYYVHDLPGGEYIPWKAIWNSYKPTSQVIKSNNPVLVWQFSCKTGYIPTRQEIDMSEDKFFVRWCSEVYKEN